MLLIVRKLTILYLYTIPETTNPKPKINPVKLPTATSKIFEES